MSYYIYESHAHNKAIIHKGDCQYCQNGSDRQGTRSTRDGSWMGPYQTHDLAIRTAAMTRRKLQSSCKHCIAAPVNKKPGKVLHG